MPDERIDFLGLKPSGGSILIMGGFDQVLATRIAETFEHIVLADWDRRRLEATGENFTKTTCETLNLVPGSPEFPLDQFNMIMTLWAIPYLGNPSHWLELLLERLVVNGRLLIVDHAERDHLQRQELTRDLFRLRLEMEALRGVDIHPGIKNERLIESVKLLITGSLRHKTFTDPDLIVNSSFWNAEFERVKTYESDFEGAQNVAAKDSVSFKIKALDKLFKTVEPGTPPLFILSTIKKSAASFYASENISQHLREETASMAYHESGERNTAANPYDRLLLHGLDSLRNQELMTIILAGLPSDILKGFDPEQLTKRLIREYGNKAISEEKNPGRLAELLGISRSIACMIVAVFEIGRRFYSEPRSREPVMRSPEDCFNYLHEMRTLKKEHLRGLYLNVQNRLIHDEVISIGTLSRSVVHPREVFGPAIEHSANSLILAHNHPSGDLTPSEADVSVTKQLAQVGRIMGIELVDHLIISADGFISLKKKAVL